MFTGYQNAVKKQTLQQIHLKSLEILEKVGLRIMYDGFYPALEAHGAMVDKSSQVVKFPAMLIEKTIENMQTHIKNGKEQAILNGIMSTQGRPGMEIKFAGASIEFLDPINNIVREPTEQDLIKLIQFGQSIPEVKYVGNPVCYLYDSKGEKIPGNLQRIMTAALVAQHTTKYGSNEVWNEKELDLLIELGQIVKGSKEAFDAEPCFITAKETISPLIFPEEDGKVLYMLAKRNLPCTIIPMPISGASSQMTISANVAMANAEILGVMAAIYCSFPDAVVGGGVISGFMDMKSASACFGAPEAIMQDATIAVLYEKLYGQNFGMGTGYIDALYPGAQSAVEIYTKMEAAYQTGRYNYPVGLLLGGKRWSPVQALIGIEMAKLLHRKYMEVTAEPGDIDIDIISEVGIGGSFMGEEDTVVRCRKSIWMPDLMERTLVASEIDCMIENATQIWSDFLKKDIEPCISDDVAREINKWKKKAIRILA